MHVPIRKFGISDPDRYWREREAGAKTNERRLHRFLVASMRRLFPDGGTVLDCGVGDGHVTRLARQHFQTYGVEYSPEAFKFYDFPTDNITLADLNRGIPEFPVAFDVIMLSMILHWLDDPVGFLREATMRLTPRGRIIAVMPNLANYEHRWSLLRGRWPAFSLSHRNFLVADEWREVFTHTGLAVEWFGSDKRDLRNRLWPRVFAKSLIFILRPQARQARV